MTPVNDVVLPGTPVRLYMIQAIWVMVRYDALVGTNHNGSRATAVDISRNETAGRAARYQTDQTD